MEEDLEIVEDELLSSLEEDDDVDDEGRQQTKDTSKQQRLLILASILMLLLAAITTPLAIVFGAKKDNERTNSNTTDAVVGDDNLRPASDTNPTMAPTALLCRDDLSWNNVTALVEYTYEVSLLLPVNYSNISEILRESFQETYNHYFQQQHVPTNNNNNNNNNTLSDKCLPPLQNITFQHSIESKRGRHLQLSKNANYTNLEEEEEEEVILPVLLILVITVLQTESLDNALLLPAGFIETWNENLVANDDDDDDDDDDDTGMVVVVAGILPVTSTDMPILPPCSTNGNDDGDDDACQYVMGGLDPVFPPGISNENNTTNATDLPLLPPCPEDDACKYIMSALMDPIVPPSTQAAMKIPGTCQHWAREWLRQEYLDVTLLPEFRIRQRYAMIVFYCEMDGSNWSRQDLWLSSPTHECDWPKSSGVNQCGWQQQFHVLRLEHDRLRGTLPPELVMIPSLWELNLPESFIEGTIPTEYAQLTELDTLILPFNQLWGEVPEQVWKYEDIVHLDLNSNGWLQGSLPDRMPLTAPNFKVLRLDHNAFYGTLPQDFEDLDWTRLHLDNNFFGGSIPVFQGQYLQELYLNQNDFSGEFPAEFFDDDLSSLEAFILYANPGLYGDINYICKYFDVGNLKVAQVDLANIVCECCGNGDNFRSGEGDNKKPKVLLPDESTSSDTILVVEDYFGKFNNLINENSTAMPLHSNLLVNETCDWSLIVQPHVMRQCQCHGEITIVAEDIEWAYLVLKREFMAVIYEDFGGYDLPVNSCDPRNQALLWLASGNTRSSGDLLQRYVAATLFISTQNGTAWNNQELWLSDESECLWWGVMCNSDSQIDGLLLDFNNIVGTIPLEIMFLRGLTTLKAIGNRISGTIPPYLFALPAIQEIQLSSNELTGSIQSQVGHATSLEVLKIGGNNMLGTLVSELGVATKLRSVDISFNEFIRSIPTELGSLSNLKYWNAASTRISGTVPSTIGEWRSLETVLLLDVLMKGPLPTEVGLLNSLQDMRVANAGIEGTIPIEIGGLANLRRLDLSDNRLSSTICSELGLLTNLQYLALRKNHLTGSIPKELGNLTSLTRLDLFDLWLSGALPPSLGQLTLLKDLATDMNDIVSSIPDELCELRNKSLQNFVVDCPTARGRGVGNFSDASGLEDLLKRDGNCFTFCRR